MNLFPTVLSPKTVTAAENRVTMASVTAATLAIDVISTSYYTLYLCAASGCAKAQCQNIGWS
jgi:hypothetical protein